MAALCPSTETRGDAPGVPWTLGSILRVFLPLLQDLLKLGAHKLRVLAHLAACGTPQLGANLFACPHCQHRHWAPRSCGDRHCPACLAPKSQQWLHQQSLSLLPIPYYHCVFTLPAELHPLVRAYPRQLYQLLFDSTSQTLLEFGLQRLKGDLGISAVLHTWGQQLNFHPHVHCIVTGGALSQDRLRWRRLKTTRFLFPVKALGALFRGKFLAGVRTLLQRGEITLPDQEATCPRQWFSQLYQKRWNVYAKRPFGGPAQVLRYLANYTHRVALSNRRIRHVDVSNQTVTFAYRDYRDAYQPKTLTLSALEFIRRFSLHILPRGLVRMRHYGILANNRRQRDIPIARALLRAQGRRARPSLPALTAPRCPACGCASPRLVAFIDPYGILHTLQTLPPRKAFDDST